MQKALFYTIMLGVLLACGGKHRSASKDTSFNVDKEGHLSQVKNEGTIFTTDQASDYHRKGIEYAQKAEFEEAKKWLLLAFQLEPHNVTVLNNLGLVEMNLEHTDEAEQYFIKSTLLDSTYYKTYTNYAILLYNQERYTECVTHCEYVINNCRDRDIVLSAYINSNLALVKLGRCEQAKQYYEQVVKMTGNQEVYDEQKSMIREGLKACD